MNEKELSRREFLATSVAAGVLLPAQHILAGSFLTVMEEDKGGGLSGLSNLTKPDLRKLVSHADLDYKAPVERSEAGQPVGNGRMGTLVWTNSSTLRFQLNRVDVHAQNRDTVSFPERNLDYASGCGFIDINCGDSGEEVFGGPVFNQHLSVFDGLVTLAGDGVQARVFACQNGDVLAIEIEDDRPDPLPLNVDLRMLRFVNHYVEHKNYDLSRRHSCEVLTRNHSATSMLDIVDGSIGLMQYFREGDFYSASGIVIKVEGRASKAIYANDSTVRLSMRGEPASSQFSLRVLHRTTQKKMYERKRMRS